jgi:hypothetical protein
MYLHLGQFANGGLCNGRYQVGRLANGQLADQYGSVFAYSFELSDQHSLLLV